MTHHCFTDEGNFPRFTSCYSQSKKSEANDGNPPNYVCVYANSGKGRKFGWKDPCPANQGNCQDDPTVGDNCGADTDDKLLCYSKDIYTPKNQDFVPGADREPEKYDCDKDFKTFNFNDDLKFGVTGEFEQQELQPDVSFTRVIKAYWIVQRLLKNLVAPSITTTVGIPAQVNLRRLFNNEELARELCEYRQSGNIVRKVRGRHIICCRLFF